MIKWLNSLFIRITKKLWRPCLLLNQNTAIFIQAQRAGTVQLHLPVSLFKEDAYYFTDIPLPQQIRTQTYTTPSTSLFICPFQFLLWGQSSASGQSSFLLTTCCKRGNRVKSRFQVHPPAFPFASCILLWLYLKAIKTSHAILDYNTSQLALFC